MNSDTQNLTPKGKIVASPRVITASITIWSYRATKFTSLNNYHIVFYALSLHLRPKGSHGMIQAWQFGFEYSFKLVVRIITTHLAVEGITVDATTAFIPDGNQASDKFFSCDEIPPTLRLRGVGNDVASSEARNLFTRESVLFHISTNV